MVKGGKKKGKKEAGEDVPSVSGLSISENAPSTSQAPEEEEESSGLTGKSRKLNRKQKQAEAKAASAAALLAQPEKTLSGQASTSQIEPKPGQKPEQKPEQEPEQKSEPKPEPAKEQPKAEESDGLGLDHRGTKKKRPKKKPLAAVEAEANIATQATPSPLQPGPQVLGEASLPTSLGPTGPPPSLGPTGPPPSLGPAGPPLGWGAAIPPQRLGPASQPPGLGVGPPQGSGPVGHPPGLGVAGPPPNVGSVGPPPSVGSVRPQPDRPRQGGHGRGRGRGSMPAGEAEAIPFQAGRGRAGPGVPSVGAAQMPLQQPTGVSRQVVPAASRLEMTCRYKIPAKILGRSVRHIPTQVITNYLPMNFQSIKVYRYDVIVKPDRPKKMLPIAFKKAKEKHYPKDFIAFDQAKNCYSLNPLKDVPNNGSSRSSIQIEITDPNGKVMQFEVSFKATGIIDFAKIKQHMDTGGSTLSSPSEEIQCIDVILRQGALESYVKCGRQFFKRPQNPINLSGGLEMWTGLFQSAIFTSRAFINIDVAHKGFPIQQSLIDALTKSFRLDTNTLVERQRRSEVEYFISFIKNLRVIATLVGPPNNGQKREFTCNGLVDCPGKLMFTCERDGKNVKMSVADYFRLEKGYKIKYPNLNCVWVGPRERYIYYPMELLDIAYGQALNKQLNEFQLANMVKEAATPPIERKRKIEEVAQCMNYSSNIFFKKFGFEISNKFLEVEAKILTPPSLDTGDRSLIIPKRGSWMTNRLVKPEPLVSWGFVAIECNPVASNYEEIRVSLMNIGRQLGMEVAEPKMKLFNVAMTELRNILFSAQEKDINFVFIIVSSRVKDMYHKVKQMAERDVGILTQCIRDSTASRRINPQTIKNILLKVNSKLMGVNQVLNPRQLPNCLKNGDVMIVGADVTHPSPEQTTIPSIAAVTASMDSKCFSYNIELSIQAPKKEMIVEFADMMYDHLIVYRERNRSLPRKIYVFRDGVSEGQFAEVMNSELAAVHMAYQRLSPQQKPEVLFLLVQKRHHTRFFTVKNCANVEPGTVVDSHIVHPKELDFYLVSHQAIKGTARPTRYHAVCNDGNIPHDEVEQLTFYLCHLYSRCMRSVSYPTPTYYAHLACLRAKSLTHGQTFDNIALERKPQRLRVLDKMLRFSRMFFV